MKKVIWYEGCGVDYDTAYFLTYGKHPLPNYDKEPYIPNADLIETTQMKHIENISNQTSMSILQAVINTAYLNKNDTLNIESACTNFAY